MQQVPGEAVNAHCPMQGGMSKGPGKGREGYDVLLPQLGRDKRQAPSRKMELAQFIICMLMADSTCPKCNILAIAICCGSMAMAPSGMRREGRMLPALNRARPPKASKVLTACHAIRESRVEIWAYLACNLLQERSLVLPHQIA